MDDLALIGHKLKQFGSDVVNGTRDAFDDATAAVGRVFNGGQSQPSQGAQPTQQAPQASAPNLAQQLAKTNLDNTAPGVDNLPGMQGVSQNLNGNQPKSIAIQQPQNNPSAVKMTTASTPVASKPFTPPKVTPIKIVNLKQSNQPKAIQVNPNNGGESPNQVMGSLVSPITNTVKGEIALPAKALYQQFAEHNPEASTETTLQESPTSMQGLGGAAAIPAYLAAKSPHLSAQNRAIAMAGLGMSPKESEIQQLLTVGGEALNSTVPTGAVSDIGKIVDAVRGGETVDAAELMSRPLESQQMLPPETSPEPTRPSLSTVSAENLPAEQPPSLPQSSLRQDDLGAPGERTTSVEGSSSPNNIETPENVNEFLPRNADAERAALEEMHNTGDYDHAVLTYAQTAGVDEMTAMAAVNRTLQESGIVPKDFEGPMEPLQLPDGTPPKTAKAAQDLADTYSYNLTGAKDTEDLLRKAGGHSEEFSVRAKALEGAMSDELSPAERQAVRDNLEGVAEPGEVTPKVDSVTRVMRQLNEMGYNVLDTARPKGLSRVKNYATRLARSGLEKGGPRIRVVMNKLNDLFNTESRFGQARQVGKFVSDDGEVRYGTQGSTGIKRNAEGDLVANGKVFKPVGVSTKELNNSGVIKYENDYAKIARDYHSHVGKVKARYNALQQILRSPEKFGISDEPIAKEDVEIHGVPELEGKFAPAKLAKRIEETFKAPDRRSVFQRFWDGANHTIVQFIVANPLFHGRNLNQLAGMAAGKVSPYGPAALKASYVRLATSTPEYREQLVTRLLRAGGGLESYGAESRTVFSKSLDAVHLPHINKANAASMAKIDTGIRISLFDLLTHHNMSDEDAAKTVDEFLGDRRAGGQITRNVGMFWNYTRTQLRAAGNLRHPGVALAAAEQAAVFYGVQKAFQDWTGNKHATTGHPGLFGLVNNVNDLRQARFGALASSKVNPLINAGVNQVTGVDMYSGNSIKNDRLGDAATTLLGPLQYTTKIANGKASRGQEAAQFLTGANLPHVKGAPAAPNFTNSPLSGLNTKNAQPVANEGSVSDKTGLDQANLYYKAKDAALKAVSNSPEATDTINAYLDEDVNNQGQKVKHNPQQSLALADLLAGDSAALGAVQKFEKSQSNHDPMWDLSPGQLKQFLSYEGTRVTDPERQAMTDENKWLDPFIQKRDDYYNNNKFTSTALTAPGTPTYPAFQGQQNTDYTEYENNKDSWDSTQKSDYLNSHPDVVDAMNQVNKYYNDLGVAQGGVAEKNAPQLTQEQEKALQYYDTLPKDTGARSAWIKANPGLWGQITNALAQTDLYNINRQGAVAMYKGEGTPASELGDIYNLGQYDIAKTPNGYQLNPELAYSQGSGGGSGSSSSSTPFVTLPKRPAKHTAYVTKIRKQKVRPIRVKKSGRVKVKKSQVLQTTHIGHAGPLKIR